MDPYCQIHLGITELHDLLQASFREKEDTWSSTEVALANVRGEKVNVFTLLLSLLEYMTSEEIIA